MKRLRVLIASEPMEYGVLSYLERVFGELDRSRFEPALAYAPRRMAPQARTLVDGLVQEGIRVCRMPFHRGLGPGDAAAATRLRAEIRAFRPDLVHLHSTKAGLIGRPVARSAGVRVLYTPHGTSWHYTGRIVGRVQLMLERALRRLTDGLLAVCPEEAQAFVDDVGFPSARVRVIRNGVPLPSRAHLAAARRQARATLEIPDGETWAVCVGRLTREKGLDVLLRALAAPVGLGGLLVVGDGPERAALETLAAHASLPVRFCGYHQDVSSFLAAADVFVQPSRSEGLPFSLLEAMAHGLPVVCSRVGGMPAAVDGCGRVVPPDDPRALGASLGRMARETGTRRAAGEAGRMRVGREFGVGAMMDALHESYEGACGTEPRSRHAVAAAAETA
jgi:glycosyltransferase involved in cell wall biosynthesis